jgi:hypothetical protein
VGFVDFELVVRGVSSFKQFGVIPALLAVLVVESIYQVVVAVSLDVFVGFPGSDIGGPEVCWEGCFGEGGYVSEEISSLFGFVIVLLRMEWEVWENHAD